MSDLFFEDDFTENGYKRVFESKDGWLVAYLNNTNDQPRDIVYMERHTTSDESFILTAGKAYLAVSANGADHFEKIDMVPGVVYNIPRTTFHGVYSFPGARMVINELTEVSNENSEHHYLTESELLDLHKTLGV